MEVTVRAPAKINLTLDAVGRRDDGYHLIESVMQAVDLFDIVTVRRTREPGIRLETDDERVPDDESNTAWRAAQAFFEIAGLPPEGVEIRIRKRIPLQAGLAGGSADAAGVLTALNLLTDSRLEGSILAEAGERVGADVPFCLTGGAALCTGTGAIVSPLTSMPDCWLAVAKPACGVSTAEAYRRLDSTELRRRPHTSVVADAVCAGDLETIGRELCNVFEEAIPLPETDAIRRIMREHRTLGCLMSGSGSAVYGLFQERETARRCAEALRQETEEVFLCRPCPHGPEEL